MKIITTISQHVTNSNIKSSLAWCKGLYFFNQTWLTEEELEAVLPVKYDMFKDPRYKGDNPDIKKNYLHGSKSY